MVILNEHKETEDAETYIEDVESQELEIVNINEPTWNREKDEISDEEHNKLFNIISKNSHNNTASCANFNTEGYAIPNLFCAHY